MKLEIVLYAAAASALAQPVLADSYKIKFIQSQNPEIVISAVIEVLDEIHPVAPHES